MRALIDPQPTGVLALAALMLCAAVFAISLIRARVTGNRGDEPGATRSASSWIGIVVQGLGFVPVGIGPVRPVPALYAPAQIAEAAIVFALAALAVGLFIGSTRVMGRNWSIEARTRADHELVTAGPFGWIRHPIYTGMFAFLIAMAIAFGHYRGLLLGVPLFWLGTMIRVAREERLLRAQFGAAYDAYAARVKRFVPGLV